jgi:hypothetical protein
MADKILRKRKYYCTPVTPSDWSAMGNPEKSVPGAGEKFKICNVVGWGL